MVVHLTTDVAGALTGRGASGIRDEAIGFFATDFVVETTTGAVHAVLVLAVDTDDEGTGSTKGTLLLFVMAKKTFSTSIMRSLDYEYCPGTMDTAWTSWTCRSSTAETVIPSPHPT